MLDLRGIFGSEADTVGREKLADVLEEETAEKGEVRAEIKAEKNQIQKSKTRNRKDRAPLHA